LTIRWPKYATLGIGPPKLLPERRVLRIALSRKLLERAKEEGKSKIRMRRHDQFYSSPHLLVWLSKLKFFDVRSRIKQTVAKQPKAVFNALLWTDNKE
jgi:hypothetical protein